MPFFRKKPVTIEARHLDGSQEAYEDIKHWLQMNGYLGIVAEAPGILSVATLEGHMVAKPGDWVLRGVQGEMYPCKDNIFKQTYEKVKR